MCEVAIYHLSLVLVITKSRQQQFEAYHISHFRSENIPDASGRELKSQPWQSRTQDSIACSFEPDAGVFHGRITAQAFIT
jgi:hypothetical protein